MKEKEKKKEIDRFRFLLLGAVFAFLIGIAANLFYDLLIGTDLTLTKALSIGLIIVLPLALLFLLIADRMKALGFSPPAPSTPSEDWKKVKNFIFRNKGYFIKFLTVPGLFILFFHSLENTYRIFFDSIYTIIKFFITVVFSVVLL